MKYGIEFEYFVKKDDKIIPAYKATSNLDGYPFIGELRTTPKDSILDCIFDLKKLIFVEQMGLEKKGFQMCIITSHQFSDEDLINFRKDKAALLNKKLEVLEEFSIYPTNKVSKVLKKGEVKASLQINFSEHKTHSYPVYEKITVEDKYKYISKDVVYSYACLFNYVSIIQKLDSFFGNLIKLSNRVPGVYAIKSGVFGDRIEYRSLPNTTNLDMLIPLLTE